MTKEKDSKWKPAKPSYPQKELPPRNTELLSRVSQAIQTLLLQHYNDREINQKLIVLSQSLLTDPVIGHKQVVFNNPSRLASGAYELLRGHVPEINEKGDLRFTPDRGNLFSDALPIVEVSTETQRKPFSEWTFSDLQFFLSRLGLNTDLTAKEWDLRNLQNKENLINKKVKEFSRDATGIEQAYPKSKKSINSRVGLKIAEVDKTTGKHVETFTVYIVKQEEKHRAPFSYKSDWQIEVVCGSGQATRYDWGKNIDWSQTVLVRKPVIYLYPTQPTQVSVSLDFTKGPVVVEYPKRENGSWSVNAQPDGKLLFGDKEYPYLFWEAKPTTPYQFDQTQGFCLGKEEFVPFFESKLKFLGLNDKEIADFITYWYPLMANNPYTHVNFLGQEYLDSAKLVVSPAPESTIRVFVVFKSTPQKLDLKPQELVKTPRNGFTLVEWGGSNLDDK